MSPPATTSSSSASSRPPPATSDANKTLTWVATLAYAAVVIVFAWHHELWRDEVRALNIAAHSHSPLDLLHQLKNEGHPALWYVLLYVGQHVTGSMLVLKPIALAVAVGAVYLLFRFGPFPPWQKLLFVAGQLPLYEYSVMCRNYGISMLLIFAAASLYRHRFTRPLWFASTLALLANTNIHSLVIVVAWLVAWIGEWLSRRPRPAGATTGRILLGLAIVVAGMACCVWVIYPDQSSIVVHTQTYTRAGVWRALIDAFHNQGEIHGSAVGLPPVAVDLLFWLFAASFLTRPWLFAAVAIAGLGLAVFARLVYPLGLRHSGVLIMFCIGAIWMAAENPAEPIRFGPIDRIVRILERHRATAFSLFLLIQVALGVPAIQTDLRIKISGAESLGRKLSSDPELRRAIVIPEPEPEIEALPYYCDNPVYLARERGYLVKVNFTTANDLVSTLDGILARAEDLNRTTGRPVVFAIGHGLAANGPFERVMPFGKVFRYSADGLRRFQERTTSLGWIGGDSGDENFFLYRLK